MRCHDIKILNILKLHQLFVNSLINFCTKGLLLTSFPKCYFLRKSDKDDTADATIIIILSQSKWGMIRMVCPKKQNRASSLASFSFLFGLFKQTLKIYVKNVHPVSIGGIWTNNLFKSDYFSLSRYEKAVKLFICSVELSSTKWINQTALIDH